MKGIGLWDERYRFMGWIWETLIKCGFIRLKIGYFTVKGIDLWDKKQIYIKNLSLFQPKPHALACGMFRKIGLLFAKAKQKVTFCHFVAEPRFFYGWA